MTKKGEPGKKGKSTKEAKPKPWITERIVPLWTIGVVVVLLTMTNFAYLNQLDSASTKSQIGDAERCAQDVELICKEEIARLVEKAYSGSNVADASNAEYARMAFAQFISNEYPTTSGKFAIEVSKPELSLSSAYYTCYDIDGFNRTKVMMPVYVATSGKVHVNIVSTKLSYERDVDLDSVVPIPKPMIDSLISKYARDVYGRAREIFEDILSTSAGHFDIDRQLVEKALELSLGIEEACIFHKTTDEALDRYLASKGRDALSRFSPASYFLSSLGINDTGNIALDLSSYGEPYFFTSEKYSSTWRMPQPRISLALEPRIYVKSRNVVYEDGGWKAGVSFDIRVSGGMFEVSASDGLANGKADVLIEYQFSTIGARSYPHAEVSNASDVLGLACAPSNASLDSARALGGAGAYVLLTVPEGADALSWEGILASCGARGLVPVLRVMESDPLEIGAFVSSLVGSGAWDYANFRYVQIAGSGDYPSLLVGAAQRLKALPGVRIVGREFGNISAIDTFVNAIESRGLEVHDVIDIWASAIHPGYPFIEANPYYDEMQLLDARYPEFGYLSGKMPVMITSIPDITDVNMTSKFLFCNSTENPDGRFLAWRPWMIEDRFCIISAFFNLEGNSDSLSSLRASLPAVTRNHDASGGWVDAPLTRNVEPASPCSIAIRAFRAERSYSKPGELIKFTISVENVGRVACTGNEKGSFEYPSSSASVAQGISIGAYGLGTLYSSRISLSPGERKDIIVNGKFYVPLSGELYAEALGGSARGADEWVRLEISNRTPSARLALESVSWSETRPMVNDTVVVNVALRNAGAIVAQSQVSGEAIQAYPDQQAAPGIPGRFRIALVGNEGELRFGIPDELLPGERGNIELHVRFSKVMNDVIAVRVVDEGLGYVDERAPQPISVMDAEHDHTSTTGGLGPSTIGCAFKESLACLHGCLMPPHAFYGARNIPYDAFMIINGSSAARLGAPGEILEYKMMFAGGPCNLSIRALSDVHGHTKANIYFDGEKHAETIFDDMDGKAHERSVAMTVPAGEHLVAVEYAGPVGEKTFLFMGMRVIYDGHFGEEYIVKRAHLRLGARSVMQSFVAMAGMKKLSTTMDITRIELLDASQSTIASLEGKNNGDKMEFDISSLPISEGVRYYVKFSSKATIYAAYDQYPLGYAIIDGKEFPSLDICAEIV